MHFSKNDYLKLYIMKLYILPCKITVLHNVRLWWLYSFLNKLYVSYSYGKSYLGDIYMIKIVYCVHEH